jgi:membrane protease YdiL (CAAX protease family)
MLLPPSDGGTTAILPDLEHPFEERPEASGPPRVPARFSLAGTIISTVLVAIFVGHVSYSPVAPQGALERPGEDLERLVSREMDLRHALELAPAWERAVYRFLAGYEDSLVQAIRWYDGLTVQSPETQLYRVILLAEAGHADRVSTAIIPWQYQGEVMAGMLEWIRAAYLEAHTDPALSERYIAEIGDDLSPGWFADVLKARLADSAGDQTTAVEAQGAIAARGAALLWKQRVLAIAVFMVLIWGCVVLVVMAFRPSPAAVGTAWLPPPWDLSDGYAIFIRGVLGFLLISAMLFLLPDANPLGGMVSLLGGIPILWLTMRYLASRGLSVGTVLGLRPLPNFAFLTQATVVLVALSLLGELAITLIISSFHFKTDWADGLLEEVLWGSWWIVLGTAVDSTLWAPVVEEVAFRGILYGTLRTKLGVAPAAILSGAMFAVVHGYGAIGFASVLWSGIIWAVAYEKTRSLWPAILAHGINNLLVTTEFAWLYR